MTKEQHHWGGPFGFNSFAWNLPTTGAQGAMIHATAVIGPNVEIEENVYIGPFCIIGFPPEWKGKEDQGVGVLIKRGTRITGHVTIDSGVERRTTIGKDCYIMKGVHIGHDALIGDQVTLSCKAIIGGHTVVEWGANIGLGAIIHQRQRIARGCMVGMGAVVTKGLVTSDFDVVVGNPARWIKKNERHPHFPEDKKVNL